MLMILFLELAIYGFLVSQVALVSSQIRISGWLSPVNIAQLFAHPSSKLPPQFTLNYGYFVPFPAEPMGHSTYEIFIPKFIPKYLSGQSAGAIRRRTSAKNRMENLFSKFDDKVHETIVKLLMLECDWPNVQIKSLARDSPHTFSLSSLEGRFWPLKVFR